MPSTRYDEMQGFIYSLATTAIGVVTTAVIGVRGGFNSNSVLIAGFTKGEVSALLICLSNYITGFLMSQAHSAANTHGSTQHALMTALGSMTGVLSSIFAGGTTLPTPSYIINDGFEGIFEKITSFVVGSDPSSLLGGTILMTGKALDWGAIFVPLGFATGHALSGISNFLSADNSAPNQVLPPTLTQPGYAINNAGSMSQTPTLETANPLKIGGLSIHNCNHCTIIINPTGTSVLSAGGREIIPENDPTSPAAGETISPSKSSSSGTESQSLKEASTVSEYEISNCESTLTCDSLSQNNLNTNL